MGKKLNTKEAKEILRKYRLGQCDARELAIINRWYNSFDKDQDDEFDFGDPDSLHGLKMRMFERITTSIDSAEGNLPSAHNHEQRKHVHFFIFENLKRIAAVFLVVSSLGLFLYIGIGSLNTEQRSFSEAGKTDKDRKDIEGVYNQPSAIYLSDGSVVLLKRGSRLEYPKTFVGSKREVRLTGEAFFDVAKDTERPFIIHAENFTTRVLGTSFNIKAYGNDESQEVAVITGKVVVTVSGSSADKKKQLVLMPNQKAIYSKKDNSLVGSGIDEIGIYSDLVKRKLVFDEVSVRQILKVLDVTYGVHISLENQSIEDCVITADLSNETLDVAIAIISRAINATYTIDGNDIMLRGGSCAVYE